MTTYKIVHVPFTIGERVLLDCDEDMDFSEAQERLRSRAETIEKKYPGCSVDWLNDSRFEVTDDTAMMVGDYQGNYYVISEDDPEIEEPEEHYADEEDDRDPDNPVESASYDNHDWDADPDWGP